MQTVFVIIGVLIFVSFAAAIFYGVLNFGNIAGMALGGLYVIFGLLINRLDTPNQILSAVIAFCVLSLIVLKMRDIYMTGKTTADREQVILVLGCRVRGNEPSTELVKRADAAYKFLLSNPQSVAILSGGQGRDENISEALCMQNILIDRGIIKDRLILEDKSSSTEENIRYSLEIMAELGMKREAAVVTSMYHQKRAQLICKRYGLSVKAVSSKTKTALLPTFLMREIFALAKEQIFRKTGLQ